MATRYDRLCFGHVVINNDASPSDPTKIGIVSFVSMTDPLNTDGVLHLSDGKRDGLKWQYTGPISSLEVVGFGKPERIFP